MALGSPVFVFEALGAIAGHDETGIPAVVCQPPMRIEIEETEKIVELAQGKTAK